jgi:hypothetical protein
MGYTAAEGLILTGQGSTSDITLKNDADAVVFTVPTGTDDILFPDNARAKWGDSGDLQLFHDASNSYIESTGTGDLIIQDSGGDVRIKGKSNEDSIVANNDGSVDLYYDNNKKFETTNTGVDITGVAVTDGITSSGNITFDNGNSSVSIKSDGADGSYIQFGANEYLRFLYDNGASESIRLIDGGGITFNGDTAAANALDDYEEGTWTPALDFGGGTTGIAYATNYQYGSYTKIGNVVHCHGMIILSNKGSSSGAAYIGGIPFSTPDALARNRTGSMLIRNVSFANQYDFNIARNSASATLTEVTEGGTSSNLTNANFANNSQVILDFTIILA